MLPGYNKGSFILFWCAARSDALDCTALYDTLQHKLQHTATHCNAQYVLVHHEIGCHGLHPDGHSTAYCNTHNNVLRCNTLQRILYSGALQDQLSCIIRNAPQHTATTLQPHCNHTATTLQPHCNHTATHCNALQHTATHCNTLQHVANTLQHTLYSGALPVQIALHQERHSTAYRNKLQHKLQYTIYSSALRNQMRWNSLPPHCNTAKHTATYLNLTDALPPLQAPSPVLQS